MLTSGIFFKTFKTKKIKTSLVKKKFLELIKEKNQVIQSLSKEYENSFDSKIIKKIKSSSDYRIIGMGGSSLGARAIYNFLKSKISKKFIFVDNLQKANKQKMKKKNKNYTNLIISKSGNTIETIVSANILLKKKR